MLIHLRLLRMPLLVVSLTPKYKIKIILNQFEFAFFSFSKGVHRIELCSALSEGGLTPTVGLLKLVKQQVGFNRFSLTCILSILK